MVFHCFDRSPRCLSSCISSTLCLHFLMFFFLLRDKHGYVPVSGQNRGKSFRSELRPFPMMILTNTASSNRLTLSIVNMSPHSLISLDTHVGTTVGALLSRFSHLLETFPSCMPGLHPCHPPYYSPREFKVSNEEEHLLPAASNLCNSARPIHLLANHVFIAPGVLNLRRSSSSVSFS